MSLDTARAFYTYTTALFVVVGGFVFLYLTRLDPEARDLQTIVAGFVGFALQFLFGSQAAQQAVKQTQESQTTPPVAG